jgi:hypothetical protein
MSLLLSCHGLVDGQNLIADTHTEHPQRAPSRFCRQISSFLLLVTESPPGNCTRSPPRDHGRVATRTFGSFTTPLGVRNWDAEGDVVYALPLLPEAGRTPASGRPLRRTV